MPESETVRKQLIALDVDTAAARRVKAHVTELKRDLTSVKITAAQVTQGFGQANRQAVMIAQLTREVTRLKNETRGAADESRRLTQARQQQQATLARSAEGIRSVGAAASLLGPNVSAVTSDIAIYFRAAKGLQALGAEMPTLASEAIKAAGGLGNLTLAAAATGGFTTGLYLLYKALQDNKQASEEYRKALEAQLTEEERRTAFIAGATKADVEAALEAERQKQAVAQGLAEDYTAAIERGKEVTAEYWQLVEDESAAAMLGPAEQQKVRDRMEDLFPIELAGEEILDVGQLQDVLSVLQGRYNAQTDIVNAAQIAIDDYTAALINNETAANDLDAANKQRADGYKRETDLILTSKRMSAEQIRDRLSQIRTEQQWYGALERDLAALAPTSQYAADMLKLVQQTMADLGLESSVLQGQLGAAETTELQTDAVKWLTGTFAGAIRKGAGVITDSVTAVGDTFAASAVKVDEYKAKLAELEDDRRRATVREEADAARQRVQAIADHYRDLAALDEQYHDSQQDALARIAEIEGDAKDDRLEVLRESNKESQRETREHKRRIADIERRADQDILSSALELDAIGVWRAQKAAEQELRDERDQYAEQQRRRDEDLQDQLRQLRRQRDENLKAARQELDDLARKHTRERDARITAFQQDLAREDQERAIKRARQAEDWRIADQRLADHYGVIATNTSSHYTDLQGRTTTGMANVAAAFSTGLGSLVTATRNTLASASTAAPRVLPNGATPNAYAAGGDPPVGQIVRVGEQGPEWARFLSPVHVYSARDSQAMMGGVRIGTLNIPISGNFGDRSDEQVYTIAYNAVYDAFMELGA